MAQQDVTPHRAHAPRVTNSYLNLTRPRLRSARARFIIGASRHPRLEIEASVSDKNLETLRNFRSLFFPLLFSMLFLSSKRRNDISALNRKEDFQGVLAKFLGLSLISIKGATCTTFKTTHGPPLEKNRVQQHYVGSQYFSSFYKTFIRLI